MMLSAQGERVGVWQYGSEGRDEFVDLCMSQDQINIAGYVGAGADDQDILIDRLSEAGEPRDSE